MVPLGQAFALLIPRAKSSSMPIQLMQQWIRGARRGSEPAAWSVELRMERNPDSLATLMPAAITATGIIWSRYSTQITPVNYNLLAVNAFMQVPAWALHCGDVGFALKSTTDGTPLSL
jgi:hypothetical protein